MVVGVAQTRGHHPDQQLVLAGFVQLQIDGLESAR
jgi:hypothetical protein